MTTKPFVHSYSAGKMFEQCPHRFHEDRVLRRFPFVQGPEAKEGDEIHKAFELNIARNKPFARKYKDMEAIAQAAKDKPGVKLVEAKWGLTKQFKPCGYFDDKAYYRYKNDYIAIDKSKAVLLDWKTGKDSYPDIEQLVEGAVCAFQHFPEIETVEAALVFVKAGTIQRRTYVREDLDDYIDAMAWKYGEIDAALKANDYPKTPTALCPWCPVTECEFWKPKPNK